MASRTGIVTAVVALGTGCVDGGVTAAFVGAVGDEAAGRLFAAGKRTFKAIADPAAMASNHHFLRVVRTARLNAFKRLALETRDALNITREKSPFLRDLEVWIETEAALDMAKALDPRALAPRQDAKPPEADDLTGLVRGMASAAEMLRGLFARSASPADAERFFTIPDKLGLLELQVFFYSDARMQAGVQVDDAIAVRQSDEQAALRAAIEIAAFGEMVIATSAEDINWQGGAPESFRARFNDPARGFFATLRNEIHSFMVEDAAFRSRFAALMSADQLAAIREMAAQLVALRADLEAERKANNRSGPDLQVEAAFKGGRLELLALGNQSEPVSDHGDPGLQYLRDQAGEHIEHGRLSEARLSLLELRARQREIRQGISLDEGRTEAELGRLAHARARYFEAADHFAAAAGLAQSFDPEVYAQYKSEEANSAAEHGEVFAGLDLLRRSVAAYEAALTVYTQSDMQAQWAATQNNLGTALSALGDRLGGEAGAQRLSDAVAAYEAALTVRTQSDMPADWAMTQNNLGVVLGALGTRLGGEAGAQRLSDAVAAHEAALTVYTQSDMQAQWAATQNNLGTALSALGDRLGGEAGAQRLSDAVAAYEAALTVRTQSDMPADWAMTQNNLGVVLGALGTRLGGEAGAQRLSDAVAAYEAALTVYTEAEMPADRAMTQENIGLAQESIAALMGGRAGRDFLVAAVTAFELSLTVYTQAEMPFYWDKASASLDRVRARLAELDGE